MGVLAIFVRVNSIKAFKAFKNDTSDGSSMEVNGR